MNRPELFAVFNAAMEASLTDDSVQKVLVERDASLTKTDLFQLTGLGVETVATLVGVIANLWEVTPLEAWKTILSLAADSQLPGEVTL